MRYMAKTFFRRAKNATCISDLFSYKIYKKFLKLYFYDTQTTINVWPMFLNSYQ